MELKILEHSDFGEIRTTTDEKGNVLFCGYDVAVTLGYSNPRDALNRHCRCVVKHDVPHPQNRNKRIEMTFIPEPDIYRLVTKSKLPAAVEFERWVFEDVLPSLRKHGMYASDELLKDPELLLNMARHIQTLQDETMHLWKVNGNLERENEMLGHILSDHTEKMDYLTNILNSDCTMTSSQIAADYGISAIKLNRLLHMARVQRKVGGQWILYCDYMNRGLTNSETVAIAYYGFVVRTRWTQRGRLLIHEILANFGITPSGGL